MGTDTIIETTTGGTDTVNFSGTTAAVNVNLGKTTFNAVTNSVGQALTDFAVVTNNQFVNASKARIVFSQSSGSLFYNRDGNLLGTGTVFEFARLGNPDITLSSSNFSLIV